VNDLWTIYTLLQSVLRFSVNKQLCNNFASEHFYSNAMFRKCDKTLVKPNTLSVASSEAINTVFG